MIDIDKIVSILEKADQPRSDFVQLMETFKNPYLVLIACILSLRTNDKTTYPATLRMLELAGTPEEMMEVDIEDLEKAIYPVGFYKNKAKQIIELSKEIVENFLTKFGFNSQVLYIGDTTNKFLYKDDKKLEELKCFNIKHEELPDVIAYSKDKNLLFLCEAVHSAGPMSEIRVRKLKEQLNKCTAEIIFITAFLTKKDFKKWILDIAWETEVWIAETPEHMVHFNGYKFLEIH